MKNIKTKQGKKSYRDSFIDALKKQTNGEQKLISNTTLRGTLGWNEDRYDRIKDQLKEEKLIIIGRGQGGTVGLSSAPGAKALKLFISYSHADESLKNDLLKHFSPLKRLKLIESWHDRKINAGGDFSGEIFAELEKADIAVFLLSAEFIDSFYCYEVELERALELQAENKLTLIPIILRACLWQYTPLSKLLALPKDGKAITAWHDKDEAMVDVAEGIRLKALQILESQ